MKETTVSLIPKEQLDYLKEDEKFIEYITNEISERIIKFLEENYEIIPKKPVVRCKDCKYLEGSEGVCKVLSNNCEPPVPVYVGDNDFCSHGERREDD